MTMKDGIANCSVISPFNAPIRVPSTIATAEAIQTGTDISFINIAATTDTNVAAVPTDRSNSPAIIRTPTPKATIPRDGIACSITEIFGPDRYLNLVRRDQRRRNADDLDGDENDQNARVGRPPETPEPTGETGARHRPRSAVRTVWQALVSARHFMRLRAHGSSTILAGERSRELVVRIVDHAVAAGIHVGRIEAIADLLAQAGRRHSSLANRAADRP